MATAIEFAQLADGKAVATFIGKEHGATVSFFAGTFGARRGPRLHRHPYDETFIVEDGSATFTVDGETVEARAGDIVVVPGGAAHKFLTGEEGMRSVNIHAAAEMETEWLEE